MGLFEALSAAVISRYLQMLVASRRALCISFHELSLEQRLIARCEVPFGPGVDLSLEAFPQSLPLYHARVVVKCDRIWSGEGGV